MLDVEKVNLLVGPLFIEKQIQHGWGGYVAKNHIMGSYVLSLALWCARVHSYFIPDWWLPVINHLLKSERLRLRKILQNKPTLNSSITDQLNKEGAIMWTDDSRALQNRGCDTSILPALLHNSSSASVTLSNIESVELIEQALSAAGILYLRRERASRLYEKGFKSVMKLTHISLEDFEGEALFDEDFIKLLTRSLSARRCDICDFAPLICPRCLGLEID